MIQLSSSQFSTTAGYVILLLNVDCVLINGDIDTSEAFHKFWSCNLKMKGLGLHCYFLDHDVSYALGMCVLNRGMPLILLIIQLLHIQQLVVTPLVVNAELWSLDGELLLDPSCDCRLAGLVYLTATRPGITLAIHLISQFVVALHRLHYAVVSSYYSLYQRYFTDSLFYPSTFYSSLQAYTNADWATGVTDLDLCCAIVYCVFLGDFLIEWKFKKHEVVSRSSTEYLSMAYTIIEII